MSIFSFLGFYYSLAHARIANALDRDPSGTRRKYNLVRFLWFTLFAISVYFDIRLLSGFLFLLLILAAPLIIPLAGEIVGTWVIEKFIPHDEKLERRRREQILKQIDKREADESASK